MKKLRLGIIGTGIMGQGHARYLQAGEVPRCELTAVCDTRPENLQTILNVEKFSDPGALISSGKVDAVLIATPHYSHTSIGIDALRQGLHVLVEKPISVHKADCERLLAAHRNPRQVFGAMFNLRTNPLFRKAKALIDNREIGPLVRVNYIITDWFRTESYYASGGWRGTWEGEGGGVLLNQCPHQLDMLQWLCGMPTRVHGMIRLGGRHAIEVEDEVTAILEYPNGAGGVFVTSTGETPGTNRLEICGENGRLLIENGSMRFTRNEVPTARFSRASKKFFDRPPVWEINFPGVSQGGSHREIMLNFVNAVLDGEPLLAPAAEGIRSVELGNAMLLAGLTGKPVDMPLNGAVFERHLKALIRTSRTGKRTLRRATRKSVRRPALEPLTGRSDPT